jgi:3-oxoacyl-[acyl-carrier protein] reductase
MSSNSAQARLAAVAGAMSGSYPNGLLAGEVAIITGVRLLAVSEQQHRRLTSLRSQAAQGIGKAVALTFAKEGAKVVVSDLDEGELQRFPPHASICADLSFCS